MTNSTSNRRPIPTDLEAPQSDSESVDLDQLEEISVEDIDIDFVNPDVGTEETGVGTDHPSVTDKQGHQEVGGNKPKTVIPASEKAPSKTLPSVE